MASQRPWQSQALTSNSVPPMLLPGHGTSVPREPGMVLTTLVTSGEHWGSGLCDGV